MTAYTFDHEGTTFELPDPKAIKPGILRKARKGKDETDQMFLLLELTLGEDSDALAALDDMDGEKFSTVVGEWLQGAQLGESSGSSN
jgi:hypothetical protein